MSAGCPSGRLAALLMQPGLTRRETVDEHFGRRRLACAARKAISRVLAAIGNSDPGRLERALGGAEAVSSVSGPDSNAAERAEVLAAIAEDLRGILESRFQPSWPPRHDLDAHVLLLEHLAHGSLSCSGRPDAERLFALGYDESAGRPRPLLHPRHA